MRDVFMFADNMMYKAKAAGKGQVFLPTEEDIIDVFKDINDKSVMISQAVKERKVVPYFQPLMQLNSGDVSAVEVLCRIEMANGKVMPAHEFIEIAEKLGIIHQLDLVMLEKAIKQAEKENYKGALFINISPRSLILSEFIPGIIKIVNQFNIARERIVFEITERDTVKNMTLLKQFVEGLRVEGFKLAVDDFGSGFSSFHYLKHFEIDYVKIEGEFIANILKDEKDFAVVKSIANLAKELKAETIAEFVESEAILDSIKSIGITYGQGYHIRKPMPFILNKD
jgi:EAL domain-containing protein (putative c-di-GMP-specific phosphodiesterase class I)